MITIMIMIVVNDEELLLLDAPVVNPVLVVKSELDLAFESCF